MENVHRPAGWTGSTDVVVGRRPYLEMAEKETRLGTQDEAMKGHARPHVSDHGTWIVCVPDVDLYHHFRETYRGLLAKCPQCRHGRDPQT